MPGKGVAGGRKDVPAFCHGRSTSLKNCSRREAAQRGAGKVRVRRAPLPPLLPPATPLPPYLGGDERRQRDPLTTDTTLAHGKRSAFGN